MNAHVKPAGLTVQHKAISAELNPAGGEPQRARPAARPYRRPPAPKLISQLSPELERALLILERDGKLTRAGRAWRGAQGEHVLQGDVKRLYDRYLVRCLTSARSRKLHRVELTEMGEHVARDLRHFNTFGSFVTGIEAVMRVEFQKLVANPPGAIDGVAA